MYTLVCMIVYVDTYVCVCIYIYIYICMELWDPRPLEACELWSCYVDFLLANGAPLAQLRDVQAGDVLRGLGLEVTERRHNNPGDRKP